MGRILFELLVLGAIVVSLVMLAGRLGSRRREAAAPRAIAAPADARWSAINVGNAANETEVAVVLRSPHSDEVWDRRLLAVIPNRDPDYDRLLYNAIEDARSRAALLNSLRSQD